MPVYYTRLIYDRHIEATNPEAAKMELLDMLNEAYEDLMSIIETFETDVPPVGENIFKASEMNEKLVYHRGPPER